MRSILLVLCMALLAACTPTEPPAPEERHGASPLVSAEYLSDQIDEPDLVILHVARQADHYEEGHLPGARFVPLSAFAEDRGDQINVLPSTEDLRQALEAGGVSDESRVVLYGDLGGLTAARAFFALDAHGFRNASVLDGGLEAWRRSGGALSTEPPAPGERGALALRLDPDVVLTAGDVEARRTQAVLVDARPAEQHTGDVPGGGIARPGHIPDSANLFWQDDLQADGTLRPLSELRERYEAAGVTAGREVITYCRTGVQASHAYLVLRALGMEPLLYDGSFYDWSNNTDLPVARG